MRNISKLMPKVLIVFMLLTMFTTLLPTALTSNVTEAAASGNTIVKTAYRYLGRPYVFGATGPRSFDCSGFVRYVYRQHGIYLPRTAASQSRVGTSVSKRNLRQGDIVFFKNTYKAGISHVGIYVGNNRIIHAFPRKGVNVQSLSNSYLKAKYALAKRVLR